MNSTSAVSTASPESAPPVILRGTGRGLEILVAAHARLDEIVRTLESRLEHSPGFFAGSDVTLRLAGRLPAGALSRLETVTARFGLRITEVRPERAEREGARADRSTPPAADRSTPPPAAVRSTPPAAAPEVPLGAEDAAADAADAMRLLMGPVRSGAVVEAPGNLLVMGDVNPGAEVRAGGNIVVMGSLRGIAHAACGGTNGYIIALRFAAQQLRIGALIARGDDGGGAARGAEIAHASGGQIIVESYQGRLPSGLGAAKR